MTGSESRPERLGSDPCRSRRVSPRHVPKGWAQTLALRDECHRVTSRQAGVRPLPFGTVRTGGPPAQRDTVLGSDLKTSDDETRLNQAKSITLRIPSCA